MNQNIFYIIALRTIKPCEFFSFLQLIIKLKIEKIASKSIKGFISCDLTKIMNRTQ